MNSVSAFFDTLDTTSVVICTTWEYSNTWLTVNVIRVWVSYFEITNSEICILLNILKD